MHVDRGHLYQGILRGAGIGSKFIDYIGEKYPDAILRLEVEEENERAVNVYKKNGFSISALSGNEKIGSVPRFL